MIFEEIKADAKRARVLVFFDMDGTVAEYDVLEDSPKADDFYCNKRPIHCMISKAEKLSKMENVEVGICSICRTAQQRESKIAWLQNHMPFVSENLIHVIAKDEIQFLPESKFLLKGQFLTKKYQSEIVYLIEDDLRIIKATKEAFANIKITHLSRLLD